VFAVSQVGTLPLLGLGAIAAMTTHIDALYFAVIGAGTVLLEGLVAAFRHRVRRRRTRAARRARHSRRGDAAGHRMIAAGRA